MFSLINKKSFVVLRRAMLSLLSRSRRITDQFEKYDISCITAKFVVPCKTIICNVDVEYKSRLQPEIKPLLTGHFDSSPYVSCLYNLIST